MNKEQTVFAVKAQLIGLMILYVGGSFIALDGNPTHWAIFRPDVFVLRFPLFAIYTLYTVFTTKEAIENIY